MRVLLSSGAAVLIVLSASIGACTSEPDDTRPSSSPKAVSAETMAKAGAIYQERCANCHGRTGASDGPQAKTLEPKPRKFTDAAWQDSVTDAQIEKIIKVGGASVGKSLVMPPNADLSSEVIQALRLKVRGFKR